ncbi:hypothetical protein [[Mycobacterium] nativiensis]|uniref:PE domain-containing protein n=1 Tax=[Mycobacterium] nativiensis TaxID=2855503 RepID=A0ABU5Y524_9MYCO|nr:hypothetical protein [Mycolicibacter sp. MYC340]MEB3034776.1 hypothetical protein [Mycolicibacter sp. MYC340]
MEFVSGDQPATHVLHYAGQSIGLFPEQARGVAKAIHAATNGTTNMIQAGITDYASGATVQHVLLIGPGIPALLVGPPVDLDRQ